MIRIFNSSLPLRLLLMTPLSTPLLLVGLCAGVGLGAEPDWKVGLASIVITPKEPVMMSGYASRNKPSEGVENNLYLKVLALEDREGHRGVIITSDLIGFRATIAEALCDKITSRTGLKRGQILINSSHTHTGPTPALPVPGETPAKDTPNIVYTRWLLEETTAVVEKALGKMEPATLAWSVGLVNFPMNRREFTEKGVILGVNPRGPVDRSVPVLRVTGANGKTRAILFGAACHNTTLGGRDYKLSGDFAGFAQEFLEKDLPGVQAMFMQGCAGDANPHPKGTYDIAREHGAELGKEVVRVLGAKLQPMRGPLATGFDHVDIPLAAAPTKEEIQTQINQKPPGGKAYALGQMLEALGKGETLPTSYRAPLAVWQFGNDLTLVALSGEVVVDYVFMIEKAIGPLKLWIAAYSNDVYGYLPSARVLEEGGYETRGLYSGGIGLFSPDSEKAVVKAVQKLARSVKRP